MSKLRVISAQIASCFLSSFESKPPCFPKTAYGTVNDYRILKAMMSGKRQLTLEACVELSPAVDKPYYVIYLEECIHMKHHAVQNCCNAHIQHQNSVIS